MTVDHATLEELEAGLLEVRRSPADGGAVELIVRRPAVDEREELEEGVLDPAEGLVGDRWHERVAVASPDTQLTLMNARFAALVARTPDRRALAGDQLYVDLDLSEENLPPGTRLAVGCAVIEVTAEPHTGCAKFSGRFGPTSLRFVSTPAGRALRLRGMYAKVVAGGVVRRGDTLRRV